MGAYNNDIETVANNNINLDDLTDQQKTWITQMSYLDISDEGREKIRSGGLTVAELRDYLDDPDKSYFGVSDGISNMVMGKDSPITMTNAELLDELCDQGLGDLKITEVSEEKTFLSSGFQAMAFEDSYGNTGISYRGTDIDLSRGGIRDIIEADIGEYFFSDSTQIKEAKDFFNNNKSNDGNNYVYGYSLGGNLTQHVYLDNHSEINEAFTLNGNPINQKLIDTPEKLEAFNDPDKFHCNVICGDVIGNLKSCDMYQDNVHYIKNTGHPSGLSSHFLWAAEFNQDGSFASATREEAMQEMSPICSLMIKATQGIREFMNGISENLEKMGSDIKEEFDCYKQETLNFMEGIIDKIQSKSVSFSKDSYQKELYDYDSQEIELEL